MIDVLENAAGGPALVSRFPRRIREIENTWIPLSDGCRLAARIWLPVDAESEPVPAILEYLPYRKRDGTAGRDERNHPYMAGHGYACVRVDIRGNGESEGVMLDEYLPQEQDDALEVIAWIAAQAWCDGNVGMMGISWGGFNALQVAARQPPALRAIITVCSTDDRYADDIHYKGGALLLENLGWASTVFAYSSRPPDPALVGDAWRAMWRKRLESAPLLVERWLEHQRRDAYWKHGSVCEDFQSIEAAVLAVGGWADAYSNAIPRLLDGLEAPTRALIGPWIHAYPHLATPGPAVGFLQESLHWWDRWLKGAAADATAEALCRAYLLESAPPSSSYDHRDGRWFACASWPPPEVEQRLYALNPGCLETRSAREQTLSFSSAQDTGGACGEYCAMWTGPEGPGDQREDDVRSLCFDSPPLQERLEIAGAPRLRLELSADRPRAMIAVRLCDVRPEGQSTRVTYGILNLTHRESHEFPEALQPGTRYSVELRLDHIAYAFPVGHRIRLALSTAYWPMVWPSPEVVTLSLYSGSSVLELPICSRPLASAISFEPPVSAPPRETLLLRPEKHERCLERCAVSGSSITTIVDDFGERRIRSHGLTTSTVARETYSIHPDDPLSAKAETHWSEELGREDWKVRTETRTEMWADQERFFVRASLEAFEGEERMFHRSWDRSLARDLI